MEVELAGLIQSNLALEHQEYLTMPGSSSLRTTKIYSIILST